MKLNEKIILQRELHGMSQKQMAEAIGVDIEILKQWENGEQNPDREAIAKMSAVFGVTADDLLFENYPDAEMLQDGLTQAQRKFVKIASVLNWILYGVSLFVLIFTLMVETSEGFRKYTIFAVFSLALAMLLSEIFLTLKKGVYIYKLVYIPVMVMGIALGHYLHTIIGMFEERTVATVLPGIFLSPLILEMIINNSFGQRRAVYRQGKKRRFIAWVCVTIVLSGLFSCWAATWRPNVEIYTTKVSVNNIAIDNDTDDSAMLNAAEKIANMDRLVGYVMYYEYREDNLSKEGIKFLFSTLDKEYVWVRFTDGITEVEKGRDIWLPDREISLAEDTQRLVQKKFEEYLVFFKEEEIEWQEEYGTHVRFEFTAPSGIARQEPYAPVAKTIIIGNTVDEHKFEQTTLG